MRILITLSFHLFLVSLPKIKRLLSSFCHSNWLLLNFHSSFFIFIKDALVSWHEYRSRYWLTSELVPFHTILFFFFLLYHLLNFTLSNAFRLYWVTDIECKRFRDRDPIPSFTSTTLWSWASDVILVSKSLISQILSTKPFCTCISYHSLSTVISFKIITTCFGIKFTSYTSQFFIWS